jgi:hypothetical protein
MAIAGYVCVYVQLYCVGFHSLSLAQNRQTIKKEQADKHTRKETTKRTKENRRKNTNGNMQSATT